MLATRTCFVHGDYSPKNILVGGDEPWVIDFEVVHLGDPVFDLAFMLNHLLLKSLHRPELADALKQCARAFFAGYEAEAPTELIPDGRYLRGHVGCLMLARVDGKSPAEYLTEKSASGRASSRAGSSRRSPPTSTSLEAARRGVR